MAVMLTMRLPPPDELLSIEALDPSTRASFALVLPASAVLPWLEQTLGANTQASFGLLDSNDRRALCSWIEELLFLDEEAGTLALRADALLADDTEGEAEAAEAAAEVSGVGSRPVASMDIDEAALVEGEEASEWAPELVLEVSGVRVPWARHPSALEDGEERNAESERLLDITVTRRSAWLTLQLRDDKGVEWSGCYFQRLGACAARSSRRAQRPRGTCRAV